MYLLVMMKWTTLLTCYFTTLVSAVVRLHCSQLVTQRLDPLVDPGMVPSSHVHQIVGGVSCDEYIDREQMAD